MPLTKSAKKALRQNLRRRKINLIRKKKLKDTIKQYRRLLKEKEIEKAEKYLPKVYQTIDKIAKTKFIKKGKANRLKSKLASKLKIIKTSISHLKPEPKEPQPVPNNQT